MLTSSSLESMVPTFTVTVPFTLMAEFIPPEDIMTSETRRISEIVLDFILSFAVANLGIVSNVLVIIVFAKQGFRESVNISMTTIAIWDLSKCVGASMQRMSGIMSLWSPAAAESWSNISVVVFSYFICDSSYVTSVMAAYVAVERCLCVTIPFKVKWLITPKVTFFMCVLVSVVVFGSLGIIFSIYDIYWMYSTRFNETIALYRKSGFYIANEYPLFQYYNLCGIIWPILSFVVIVVATSIIVYKLNESSKFRSGQTVGQAETAQQLSTRDRQVVKMLVVIIAVYVINLSPRIALYLAKYLIYEFYFLRKYHNLFLFVCYFLFLFDIINGAINFIIFYAMSSSFKNTFLRMFGLVKRGTRSESGARTESVEVKSSS